MDDPLEREADRVADRVMRADSASGNDTAISLAGSEAVQRQCRQCEDDDAVHRKAEGASARTVAAPSVVHEVLRSPGEPLGAETRAFMEARFGADFGGVRLHADARAAESAKAVSARAYTVGAHVVLGGAAPSPAGTEGRRLLAHELTHVVQQGRSAPAVLRRWPTNSECYLGMMSGPEVGEVKRKLKQYYEKLGAKSGLPAWTLTLSDSDDLQDKVRGVLVGRHAGRAVLAFQKAFSKTRRLVHQDGAIWPETLEALNDALASSQPAAGADLAAGQANPTPEDPAGPHADDTAGKGEESAAAMDTAGAGAGVLSPAGQEANPYRTLDVPARAAKVTELLGHWLTGRDVLRVFQASASEAEFLELEKRVDFAAVLSKLEEWDTIRLGAAGPILPAFAGRVNRVRADYLERIAREWGPQRAESFALYIIDTTTDDDVEAVLTLLAGDQELYRSIARMPNVAQRLAGRGIDLTRFKDRGWKAVDIATGFGHAAEGILSSGDAARGMKGLAAIQQGLDLPEPYRKAVSDLDMAAFRQALTPGNLLLGAADQALFGLPSTVKGIVYDLPRSVLGGVDELSQGHVVAGVELLTVPAIIVVGAALGIRAWRQARVAALLELTAEGKALYNTLKSSIGTSGMQRVAGYVQKSAAARILVVESGAEGILALDVAKGDVAAARALVAQRAALIEEAGAPAKVWTAEPGTPFARPREVPYTSPPDLQIIRPGNPLKVESLDPAKRYLWVLDEQGNFRVAAEGQGGMFPRRGQLDTPHPQAGETMLKHGDLVPGPGGESRGVARAGGELLAERGTDGNPTGRWIMNADSSYAFARKDGVRLGRPNLDAAHRLLGTTGTDTTKVILPKEDL